MSTARTARKAIVLAAGKGTRMGDLTEALPKPMLPVQGRPVLEFIVEGLAANGVTEILLIVGYRKEVIEEHFGTGEAFGVAISYVVQEVQDGTGRVVELGKDFVGEDPFVLAYGDILVPPATYAGLVALDDAEGILSVKHGEEVAKGGAVFIEDGMVTGLIEKGGPDDPTSPWYNAGIYAFTPVIFEHTAKLELSPRGEYELTDAIHAMATDGRKIRAYVIEGDWADVRDPSVLAELNSDPS